MAVYSWGANSHGQLAIGIESELCQSPELLSMLPFNANAIRSIKGGGGHVLVLDNCGQIYSCGWNNRGQLGINSNGDLGRNEFTRIPSEYFRDATIEQIAAGWDVSGAITSDKHLYIWGSNNYQQLGICQKEFPMISRPMALNLPRDEIPMQISFGLRHISVLTQDNKIYVFGKLKIKESHPDVMVSVVPLNKNKNEALKITLADPNMRIEQITSGQNHLIILTGNRTRVIGLGDNKYGQSNTFQCEESIKEICAGWTHNGFLTKSGHVFLWGRNSYGQLGQTSGEFYPCPQKLNIPAMVIKYDENCHQFEEQEKNKQYPLDIPIHLHLGSEHGLIVTKTGNVLTWGWNEHGNCGTDNTENIYTPRKVNLSSPCRLAGTGAGFCYAVCE